MGTRFNQVGLAGRRGSLNKADSFIKTIEAPIVAVASAAQQDTGIALPDGGVQPISAFIQVTTAEATASVTTVDVGIFGGGGAEFLDNADVQSVGLGGTAVGKAVNTLGSTIGYTLESANFADLAGNIVLTVAGVGNEP